MPNMLNILVKDDATTPKEWTLVPITDNPFPQWRANDPSIPIEGQPRFSEIIEKLKNGNYKVTAKLELPVMETLGASGASAGYVAPPKVAYVTTCIFTMFVDRRSTIADRANAYRMMTGILQGASETTGTGSLANTAAGDVWKGSVRPAPYTFTGLVIPS